jgi:transcriptional regulator with XRE-family HTH domain
MMHTPAARTGTYKRPTPETIAFSVRMLRSQLGWKQFALADEAGVNIKTIERIENEKKVSNENLRKVAVALKLREGAFVDPSYEPSEMELVELSAQVAQMIEGTTNVELNDFSDPRDFEKLLSAHAHNIDTSALDQSLAEEAARLTDNVIDYGNAHSDLSQLDRLKAYQELLTDVRQIESRGYTARWAVYQTEDDFGVGLIAFNAYPPGPPPGMWFRIAIVPKRLLPIPPL